MKGPVELGAFIVGVTVGVCLARLLELVTPPRHSEAPACSTPPNLPRH